MENPPGLFDVNAWRPALEKFGAVTRLTVIVYDTDARIVCGPTPSTPLFSLFETYQYDPGMFLDCVTKCLAPTGRPAVVTARSYNLGVVATGLRLDEAIVGVAVAGYALLDFSQTAAISLFAHEARVPFSRMWEICRRQQPIPEHRLAVHGELLQVLGDTILRQTRRARQYEDTAARLKIEMAAKDDFIAVLSHELRTPLSPILGWANILKHRTDNPEQRLKAAEAIERNARLELKLVGDILDFNQLVKEKMPLEIAAHDISELLRSAADTMMEMAAAKEIEIEFTEPALPLPVEVDAARMQQVFTNILSNAVKFTPPRGSVRVTVERTGKDVTVQFSDTGEGIAPEFLPHAFEAFRQQEQGFTRQHSGLGVGLALVKRLVDLHRGTVWIASAGQGQGTVVTVQLPLATVDHSKKLGSRQEQLPPHPLQQITILLIEDTEDSLEATRAMLENFGAYVIVARNGIEALHVLSTQDPELILCDLRMPQMDGFEFLRELGRRKGSRRPPIVALTGFTSASDHQRTRDAGFAGHLDKPFDDTSLLSAVQSGLSRRSA